MSLLSRVFSSRCLAPASFQRIASVRSSRVYSSDSNDGENKPSETGISSLLSSLKQKDKKFDLKDVLQRSKPAKIPPADTTESLKDIFLETENDVKMTSGAESVQKIKETPSHSLTPPEITKTSDASDTMNKIYDKSNDKKITLSPEIHEKLKSILSNLKVDSAQTNLSKDIIGAAKSWGRMSPRYRKDIVSDFRMQNQMEPSRAPKTISLTEGTRFDMFDTIIDYKVPLAEPTDDLSLLEGVDMELLHRQKSLDQRNDFISLIEISDKQWKFPLDNEVCKVEEEGVGFEEHVFLGYLIDDFPKKGPVRRFMELVINGLEQNPHMSVGQKKHQVEWFKEYFDNVPEKDLSF